jgi:hypothetical protein
MKANTPPEYRACGGSLGEKGRRMQGRQPNKVPIPKAFADTTKMSEYTAFAYTARACRMKMQTGRHRIIDHRGDKIRLQSICQHQHADEQAKCEACDTNSVLLKI